jgi:tetratricopeptide (TPR) repeat protein
MLPGGPAAVPDSPADEGARPYRRPLFVVLGLALLGLLTFQGALDYGFVNYDDPAYVTANPHVRGGVTAAGVRWAFTSFHASNYHPLTFLSHMLDCELFGLRPRGHHLTSLLLHIGAATLLFAALRRMTGALGRSAFVAAVFAVHPLRVESVVWIAERKDVLCGLFFFLALVAYAAYVRRPGWGRYLALCAAAACALMAKPMAVTLPCVLLLLDLWPLARLPRTSWRAAARSLGPLALEKAPLFALSAVFAYVTVKAQGAALATVELLDWPHRLANAAVSYVAYVGKILAPRDLAVFYPHAPIPAWKAVAAAAVVVAATALAAAAWRRAPYLTVGWLWYVGTLVPVIGLTQVGNQAMADRFTYLPGVGVVIALTWGLADLAGASAAGRRLPAAAAALAVLVLAGLARGQVTVWQDSVTLFRHALAVTSPNVVAFVNLAEGLRLAGRPEEAMAPYRAALAIEPTRVEAHAGLAAALRDSGRLDEAVESMGRALELAPEDPRFHHGMAAILDAAGRRDEAIRHLEQAVELDPRYAAAHLGLADLLGQRGETERARRHLETARALQPR